MTRAFIAVVLACCAADWRVGLVVAVIVLAGWVVA